MAHIQWKDRYNINFREIDAQHHGLLDLLNALSDLMDGRHNPGPVSRIFDALGDYAVTHFSSEERYMQAAGYPRLAQHRQEHATFVTRLKELSKAYNPGEPKQVDETTEFLRNWYLTHIIKTDQDYIPYLKRALPTAPIEGILFGLDGVVCGMNPAPLVKDMAEKTGKSEADIQTAFWDTPGLLLNLVTGQWDAARFDTEVTAWAGKPIAQDQLASSYRASFQTVPALVNLAGRLKQHQPVGLVGNATPWLWVEGATHLGLEGVFTAEVYSCEAGIALPDKALFLTAAEKLGLAPEACLLIHSDPACIDAAQAVKLQTLHYTNPVMLMAELRRMGLAF